VTKKAAVVVIPFLGLLVAWLYTEKRAAEAVRPPAGGTNLSGFLRARPQPVRIRKLVHNGKVHVEVVGKPYSSPLSLPSGSPAYIFDETGALVDWTADLGDAPSFVKKWGSLTNRNSITVEEATRLVGTGVK
jgi:hypothetical protein